ncbi:MAG TPA: hypothetical protein VMT11_12420 [Myxococcaceae bacterium]|nr:hypothetical protein [Myxococcaceae bacterium]
MHLMFDLPFRWGLLGAVLISGTALAQTTPPPGYLPTPPPNPYGAPPPSSPQPVYAQPSYGPPTYTPPPPPSRGTIELGGFFGWQASTDATAYNGTVIIDGSTSFGGTIDYAIRPGYAVELLYAYVPTKARFASYSVGIPSSDGSTSVGEHWIQIGGLVSRPTGRVEPFGTLSAGMVILHPDQLKLTDGTTYTGEDIVRFAFTAGLGFKVWVTENVGLRFEARALVPVYFSGGGVWVGTGGASVGLSGGIPFAQFDFTGGISARF